MWIVALVVVGALITAAIAVALTSGVGTEQSNGPPTPPATAPITQAPTTTAEPPTTAPTIPIAPGTVGQPSAGPLDSFRLGYEGLGPIKLGMTLAEASAAAGTDIALVGPGGCGEAYGQSVAHVPGHYETEGTQVGFGVRDGVIIEIATKNPNLYTISGVHVGSTQEDVRRTYANAQVGRGQQGNTVERIQDGLGRQVTFYFPTFVDYDAQAKVTFVDVAVTRDAEGYGAGLC